MQTSKELEIRRYLDVFHKYKWHGLIPACLVMVILAIASSFMPKVYQSTCLIEVDKGTIENPLKTQTERLPNLGEHLSIFSQHALRWDILSEIVYRIGPDAIIKNSDLYDLGKLWMKLGLSKVANNTTEHDYAQQESIIKLLRKGIKLRQKPPRFLVLEYRGINSKVNADILNTLVSVLIEQKTKSELNQVGQNYEFIKVEMEGYREKLEEAEARLKEFKEQHITQLPDNMNVNLTQLTSDKSELLACELEMKELTGRIEYIDDELKKQSELLVSEVTREANPMLIVLNQRIVDMEIELTSLGTNYTDLHPKIIELKGQIEDLKRQRDDVQESTVNSETSMLNPVYQQLAQDKQTTLVRTEVLRNRIANLKKRIAENEEKVRSMPAQEQQLLNLTRSYEVNANIYNMFLQKLEEVRLQEKLASEEKDKESFRVVEYARATFMPVAPIRLRLTMIIAMVGIGTCVGIMGLLNYFDDSIKSVEEAKEFIGKPLLGTVPSLDGRDKNDNHSFHSRLLKTLNRSW
jgi:polysaccharide chain length determinant protein (PEP-CTERM system associated)